MAVHEIYVPISSDPWHWYIHLHRKCKDAPIEGFEPIISRGVLVHKRPNINGKL